MFIFLISVRCTASDRPDNTFRFLANGGMYSFYNGFIGICMIAASGACDILIFEIFLLSSVYVEFCTSSSKSISNLKWFLSYLIVFAVLFFGFTTAAICFAASPGEFSGSVQTLSFRKQAFSTVANNALALAGALYFLWTLHYDAIDIGRSSIVSLREHSMANARKISSLQSVSSSRLKLVIATFLASYRISRKLFANKSISSDQNDALAQRICSPPHIVAASLQLTPETAMAIQTAAYPPICGTNFTLHVQKISSNIR